MAGKGKIRQLMPVNTELYTQYQREDGTIEFRKVHALALIQEENGNSSIVPVDFYDLESGIIDTDKGSNYIGLTEDKIG